MFILLSLLMFLSPPVEQAISIIKQMPECKPLLAKIAEEGGFRVVENKTAPFGAQWNPNTRVIEINSLNHATVGDVIVSLLFELHNAGTDARLRYLQDCAHARSISRQRFVRKMEQREWKNWEATCALVQIGKQRGLFPAQTMAVSFGTFDRYLDMQNAGGHTQFHADIYNFLSS